MRHIAVADRGNVTIKVVMRKKKKSCPNYREFRISEVSPYFSSQHPQQLLDLPTDD
jgi:hypothetical protein